MFSSIRRIDQHSIRQESSWSVDAIRVFGDT